jgi:hypothetical protein
MEQFIGCDAHKKFSVFVAVNEKGQAGEALRVNHERTLLATEWGKVERVLPRVRMIPGEAHRDRVITVNEEKSYFEGAQAIGIAALEVYQQALVGIRAAQRGEAPMKPRASRRGHCAVGLWHQTRGVLSPAMVKMPERRH